MFYLFYFAVVVHYKAKINNTKNNAKKQTNKANLTNNGYSKSVKSINGNSFNSSIYKKLFIPENIPEQKRWYVCYINGKFTQTPITHCFAIRLVVFV